MHAREEYGLAVTYSAFLLFSVSMYQTQLLTVSTEHIIKHFGYEKCDSFFLSNGYKYSTL